MSGCSKEDDLHLSIPQIPSQVDTTLVDDKVDKVDSIETVKKEIKKVGEIFNDGIKIPTKIFEKIEFS